MGRRIVVTSGKGGTGKTTVVRNLGAALALQGKKTLLIDMNFGLRNLDLFMGLENQVIYDLKDIIDQKCDLDDVLLEDKELEHLFFLPAPQTKAFDSITSEQWDHLVDLFADFDYILFDSPSGIGTDVQTIFRLASDAVFVLTPDAASIRNADRLISLWKECDHREVLLFINKNDEKLVQDHIYLSRDEIDALFEYPILGNIYEDSVFQRHLSSGTFVLKENRDILNAFLKTASYFTGIPEAECQNLISVEEKKENTAVLEATEDKESVSLFQRIRDFFHQK